MTINYLKSFPIPEEALPPKLRELLIPVALSPTLRVEVASMLEFDPHGMSAEHLHLQMAVVAGVVSQPIKVLNEAGKGVVEFSVPIGDEIGCVNVLNPSISGHDYIVAAWSGNSSYSYNLSEKVWMTLGLTPRCVGNDEQRLVYDDLGLPEFDVADGEISTDYHYKLKRNVCWRMSNEYLRRYLWLRGSRGVRVFFYQAQLKDTPQLREIMNGQPHVVLKPTEGVKWYELDIRENKGGILIQLWASVEAIMPELCPAQSAEGILWPGLEEPITHTEANSILNHNSVYLDDRFLEKYEQSVFYDTTPINIWGSWHCSPSYKGQWSFTECLRIGRNFIKVPVRELYKPKPEREIIHAHAFAVDPIILEQINLEEEHIASKVQRLLNALMNIGDRLSELGDSLGLIMSAEELTGFSRKEIDDNGWLSYPALSRLAKVAPLDMTQQMFLTRCKSVHELLQNIPNGYLRTLLVKAGCPRDKVKGLGSLKLIQSLLNIVEYLNEQHETVDAFTSANEPDYWEKLNDELAPLFLNNDLRIADAHDALDKCIFTLQKLGFDTANLSTGYGKALDFVMDGVIHAINAVGTELDKLLRR